ncbi:MAG: hypothetical protein ACKOQP_04745, partial [Bacteroidota bacterium]
MMKQGLEGIGLFWCLVEMLWERQGKIPMSECECIAFALRTDCDRIATLINDFDLFQNDGECFWSESIFERLELLKSKSNKAKESAKLRWNRPKSVKN